MDYVAERPGEFAIRSFHRSKTFWAFDVFMPAALRYKFPWASPVVWAVVAALNALIYTAIFAFFLFSFFKYNRRKTFYLFLAAALYALPYVFSISYPRFRYPLEPALFVLLLATTAARRKKTKAESSNKSPKTKIAAFAFTFIYVYIQIEWSVRLFQ